MKFYFDGSKYWRLMKFIPDSYTYQAVTPEYSYTAGLAFGEFQSMLSDIDDCLGETIPSFHNIELRLRQLRDAVDNDAVGRAKEVKLYIDEIEKRADAMCLGERLHREGKLPKRICHCDTKVNNMLFDENDQFLCVIDLDTTMPGFVLSDFGDFIRTAANTGAEDDPNLDNIHLNMEIFEAYAKGYLSTATFLTDLEKSLLPYGCTRMSYMQAVRFYIDYLNGDTYYQIAYPEHNLVRTKAQIRLFEEQEKLLPEMQAILA